MSYRAKQMLGLIIDILSYYLMFMILLNKSILMYTNFMSKRYKRKVLIFAYVILVSPPYVYHQ